MYSSHYQLLRNCKRIGLFDSGLGGLSVLDKLKSLSSKSQFVYLGDTARCPYGNRPLSEIVSFVDEIVAWLTNKDVDGIVIACNTSASAILGMENRISPNIPLFDLITPTAEYVSQLGINKVAVMSTAATAKSKAFSSAINRFAPQIEVIEIPSPDLVPIVEAGEIAQASTKIILERYGQRLIQEKVQALILGCTHFPFLTEPLKQLLPEDLIILDPSVILAKNISAEAEAQSNQTTNQALYVTGDAFKFSQTAQLCLGYSLGTINSISVEELSTKTNESSSAAPVL